MGESWNHELRRIPDAERTARADKAAKHLAEFGSDRYDKCVVGPVARHHVPATYRHVYSYVTGRAGRVSYATREICADHAAKVAVKYGIDLEQVVEGNRPRHASEEAFDQLLSDGLRRVGPDALTPTAQQEVEQVMRFPEASYPPAHREPGGRP